MTKLWTIQSSASDQIEDAIQEAAMYIRQGKTIAFPTETVYGLGADATNTGAIQRIFNAKGRPSDNPLIVHIAKSTQLENLVNEIPNIYIELMEALWPGPITFIFSIKSHKLSPVVTAGMSTVGIRIPNHPIALRILEAANCPVAAPSANISGRPSPTIARHVLDDLDGKIDGIFDGGSTGIGLESTVIAYVNQKLHILRPGGVTREKLHEINPKVEIVNAYQHEIDVNEKPISPGMKYAHYSPKAKLEIISGKNLYDVKNCIIEKVKEAQTNGIKTGIMTFEESKHHYNADLVLSYGQLSNPESLAHHLYAVLRTFDTQGITYILAESCPEVGVGVAVMNRLRKAAGNLVTVIE